MRRRIDLSLISAQHQDPNELRMLLALVIASGAMKTRIESSSSFLKSDDTWRSVTGRKLGESLKRSCTKLPVQLLDVSVILQTLD